MQIVYFSQIEQLLTKLHALDGGKVFITPSPSKADGLRARLQGQMYEDVITIAHFTGSLAKHLWKTEEQPLIKRKAELLLIFGILKNKYLPELGYEQFTQAYNLFSDLRSFTLNYDALSSVLEEQPEVIKNAVALFWKILDLTNYLDEHAAYQMIAERLRSVEEITELKKTYIFWGFQHLNGQQVDLLKALAIRYQVIIPFPLSLKEKVKKSDWISWVKDHKTEEVELVDVLEKPKASWGVINSREISSCLRDILTDNDQVVLGVSKLSPSHLDLIPSQRVRFKIPHELLSVELKEISHGLKKFSGTSEDLREVIKERMKSVASLKHLRGWQLYLEALDLISELSDDAVQVDSFFLKLLYEVVRLNQPRTSFAPASSEKMSIDLKDMSSLENLDRKRRVLLCVDERFEDIQSLGQNYTEVIQKSLATLGPLKRNELELLFKQREFRDLFSHGEVTVFMGEGTLKHSLIWKRLFENIELVRIEKKASGETKKIEDHLHTLEKKKFSGNFSASKLQSFIDCPRKFYFNYVDQLFPQVVLQKDFDALTSGTIIHEIIEIYFKENLTVENLKMLTRKVMDSYIAKGKLCLSEEVYRQKELIFSQRALNGIELIREIERVSGDQIHWKIEESFKLTEPISLAGKIDCMGVGSKYLFLLDFKSSEYAASSNKEILSLDAIQLWAYAEAARTLVSDFDQKHLVLGYVILDKPSQSNILTVDQDLVKKFKGLCRGHKIKDEIDQKLEEAREKMHALGKAIMSEEKFPAEPRKATTCDFCELNKVCMKSEISHVPLT